jgi:hypothetical protein
MTDIVERLRDYATVSDVLLLPRLCGEAANEIERLRRTRWVTDAEWSHAMDSAVSQFEGYVRRDELKTPEQRRRALDDAFQHAYGILALAATQEPKP